MSNNCLCYAFFLRIVKILINPVDPVNPVKNQPTSFLKNIILYESGLISRIKSAILIQYEKIIHRVEIYNYHNDSGIHCKLVYLF